LKSEKEIRNEVFKEILNVVDEAPDAPYSLYLLRKHIKEQLGK